MIEVAASWGVVARAIAGQPIRLARDAHRGSSVAGDGNTIRLGVLERDRLDVQIVAQASIVRAGSVTDEARSILRNRHTWAERYVFLEVLRAAQELQLSLPRWFLESLDSYRGVPISLDPEESLARARGTEQLPDAGAFGSLIGFKGAEARRKKKELRAGTKGRPGVRPDEDEETEESKFLRFLSNVLPANPFVAMFKNQRGVRGGGGGSGGTNLADDGQVSDAARTSTAYRARRSTVSRSSGVRLVHHVRRYPEWDVIRGSYREDWCHLHEVDPRVGPVPIRRPVPTRLLQARVRRAMLGPGRRSGAPAGDELDLERLIERRVTARLGVEPASDLVYVDRVRRSPEVGLCIVVDASSSTKDGLGESTVLEQEKDLCSAVLDVAAAVDLRTSAFAFYSDGHESVYAVRIKGYDDPWDARARRRLDGVQPRGFTRMGALLRHAAITVPARSGTRRNVVLLLSDGFPYDEGYEGRYAEADTRRALDEARALGLACACLTFGSDRTIEKLTDMFGSAQHAASTDAATAVAAAADLIELSARVSSVPAHSRSASTSQAG